MRKRISKRRWKARARAGRALPLQAIVNHRLKRWFEFTPVPMPFSFQATTLVGEFYLARERTDG